MEKQFKEKFPQWVNENGDYVICTSDDLDSLLSASILKQVKGYEVKHFYDFDNFFSTDMDKRKAIGVDIALEKGMTWDNHVVRLSKNDFANPQSANPNIIENISKENYTSKYAMSTALLIWSYYGLELPTTDEGKLLLLSIDSSYLGHYSGFKKVQNEWLRKLGFEELIEIQNKYSIKDFANVKRKFDSSMKIKVDNEGQLQTQINIEGISETLNIKIELPTNTFHLRKCFFNTQIYNTPCKTKSEIEEINNKEIFSLALTSKNRASLTYKR